MPLRSTVHGFSITNAPETQQDGPFYFPGPINILGSTLSKKTLVVPIVSAANVPQLASDVLIASLSLSRLGIFDGKYHVPVAGGREGGQPGVTTPLELFGSENVPFVIMQQRSPVLKAKKDNFIRAVLEFAKNSGFKSVLFVSGVDSTNRSDSQMHTPLYYFTPSSTHDLVNTPLSLLASLPKYTSTPTNQNNPSMPGGGLTRRILATISDNWTINTGFLIWMGMEGDNRGDAALVASAIAKILCSVAEIKEWKEPESWQQGLFGTPNDQTLFG